MPTDGDPPLGHFVNEYLTHVVFRGPTRHEAMALGATEHSLDGDVGMGSVVRKDLELAPLGKHGLEELATAHSACVGRPVPVGELRKELFGDRILDRRIAQGHKRSGDGKERSG
jgi:hypothetical protein